MARSEIELDHAGMSQLLKSGVVAGMVHGLAEHIAGTIRSELAGKTPAIEVVVDDHTTDRAASSVTVKDIRAKLYQARDGLLTRAAVAAGLEVNGSSTSLTYTTKSGKKRSATAAQIANWTRGSK